MSPANTTDPRRRLQPEQRREELVRVGVELFAEGTLDRTHVNEIIKRAGVSRTLFYHYFPSKAAFARAIVEHEILHLHDLVEQQIEPTLEAAISTFAGYVRARPDSFRALHTGGLDQDPEIAAALNTSFERYERLVLMLLGVVEPDERAMFAAKVWIDTMIALCLAWLDHPEISQRTITNMSAQTLRSLVSQVQQGAEEAPSRISMPSPSHDPAGDH
ncbi:transcriptional regulator, TetR family [Actinomyces johnsonii F0542]|jgi:transcriptional regulator, TetR family|uniref:Transcriptional regulator, TetR family n=1 Tax=Actinomyces johnsonii F0542 TaxID=1321818 RepID=U1RY64_9ACTO|nr:MULTISPECIES: TetR/AcrR family transcriptional regulator [Actinomyces]ERH23347.1 transcriptional regulator, TetR family [Actinomyces johnsonii F0542]